MSDELESGSNAGADGRLGRMGAVQAVREVLKLSEASTVMVIVCDGESLRVMGDEPDPWSVLDSLMDESDDLSAAEAAALAARAPRRLVN